MGMTDPIADMLTRVRNANRMKFRSVNAQLSRVNLEIVKVLKRTGYISGFDVKKDANKKELTSGRGPTGVAAAAIYIASILCNERRTQREVADIAGVTEVTIRNRYKELTDKLGIEIQL